jgi:rhamnosyltransferase
MVRKYWKFSENVMVKHADLLVCDSKNIEKYIRKEYGKYNPNTTYISYGAESKVTASADKKEEYADWLREKKLEAGRYYLVVGRFVPENNYETMIREYMASATDKKLAVITTRDDDFYEQLKSKLRFDKDHRICFTGTVYDKELLQIIRENAYGYIHGHEVGGTNPSLLEALGATGLNLLLDVGFNREVGEDAAMYWNKDNGNLAAAINRADNISREEYMMYKTKAVKRIDQAYSWNYIAAQYEQLFLGREK